MRSLEPWTARHDDQAIPQRVKLRVLERQRNADGLPICPDCGMPIRPGDGIEFDHELALIDGGKHAENNLRAKHRRCHRLKTAREAQERAINRSVVKSHYGLTEPSRGFPTNRNGKFRKKMNGQVVLR